MIRPAVAADLARLLAIRDAADDGALSDPALVDEPLLRRLTAVGAVLAWEANGRVAGFAATEGGAVHLLVDPGQRGAGIGRALLAAACARAAAEGHAAVALRLAPGSRAARHYLAAGWREAGRSEDGQTVLKKPL